MVIVRMVPYVLAYDHPRVVFCRTIVDQVPDECRVGRREIMFAGILWALPFALAIAAQIAGIPLLPVVLLASYFWLAGDTLGWRPFAHVMSAFASIRA